MPSWSATFIRFYIANVRRAKIIFASTSATQSSVQELHLHPASFAPPTNLGSDISIQRVDVNSWPLYLVSSNAQKSENGETVVYLHGGAFYREIDPFHWKFIAQLARSTGLDVLVPIYPLIPRPTATAAQVIDGIVSICKLSERRIVGLMGDSAGGHMALATAQYAPDIAATLKFIVLISPVLDIELMHPEVIRLEKNDPWLSIEGLKSVVLPAWRANLKTEDALASPLFGAIDKLPPVLLLSGTDDMLNADARRLSARFQGGDGSECVKGSVEVEGFRYVEEEGMIHVYPLLPCWEGEEARKLIFGWVEERLGR
ncbi:hypothetical protein HBI04_034910 [Parastagonospora nodorum]|nr:hypothetical protein HBI03_242440 [Parastagonospora nodorum]KAH4282698.1 hypothetical protein HBI04_034910 [Parastagonospora nodorum]KAH5749516.1 hypothetical protein HBI97_246640 [Parastagonospora nodorum]KAH5783046.1 hypothetical protein HBI96_244550 [Parastagonospora nodorum]KAH5833909.1 hypothetical protein HBI94_029470 [Parastagonospora nodorum]